jgi:hypothetical protein
VLFRSASGPDKILGNADDTAVIGIALSHVHMSLGSGSTEYVSVTDGTGALLINGSGLAADFSVTAAIHNLPGVTVSFTQVSVQINTGSQAVNDSFDMPGGSVTLAVQAGPYVRVSVTGASLTLNASGAGTGAVLTGDFYFDQSGTGVNKVTRIAMANIAVTIGGQGLTDGEGAFVIKTSGIAGYLSGKASLDSGGVSIGGSFGLRINKTGAAVDETIEAGSTSFKIVFADGSDVFQFFGDASINIANFVVVEGSFTISGDGTLAATNAYVFMGQGPGRINGVNNPTAKGIMLSNASFGLVRAGSAGAYTYAFYATGNVEILGIPDVSFSGVATISVNNTGSDVHQDITIGTSTDHVTVDVANGVMEFKGTNLNLTVLGQTLTGAFSFTKTAGVTIITADNVGMNLGSGVVSLTDGTGDIRIMDNGLAGQVSGTITLTVPNITFGSGFAVSINTTGHSVTLASSVVLPAGPYMKVEAKHLAMTIYGQTLTGNFAFEQVTKTSSPQNPGAAGSILTLAATDVTFALNAGGSDVASLANGEGMFVFLSGGMAGRLSGDVAFTVPGVTVSGTFGFAVNTTGSAVDEQIMVDGKTIALNLVDRKSTRLNSSHRLTSRMPSSA